MGVPMTVMLGLDPSIHSSAGTVFSAYPLGPVRGIPMDPRVKPEGDKWGWSREDRQ